MNFFDAMSQGKGSDVIGKIINELFDYSVLHFASEERYFKKYEYPETEDHLIEHAKFIDEVSDFMKKFEAKKLSLTIEVMQFLQAWLKEHIMGSDKKYAEFFKEKWDIDKI
ncbi:MAG: hemerythrin family protein [Salinivirgaceae bacterium]|nr:hemerythrin family protein [Salinivirgaceae bacterium]